MRDPMAPKSLEEIEEEAERKKEEEKREKVRRGTLT